MDGDATLDRVFRGEEIPSCLQSAEPPCQVLHVRGNLPLETVPRVAMVGSRSPSPSGRALAYEMGRGLAKGGVVVVSGLARGIDAAAQQGCVDAGGSTVGFLGCGIDVIYPRSSRELAERIPVRGAVVSEYPPGSQPLPYRFVLRNRLIAAYTQGTVVVEAGARSGALITAGAALDLGKEVWVVPGDPRRPSCRGSNRLLRDGAGVALEAADILSALGLSGRVDATPLVKQAPRGLEEHETAVWASLAGAGPADPEMLARRTGLPAAKLLEALSMLELSGFVERDEEGYSLISPGSSPSPESSRGR
jgi:DNA processing protein